MSPLDWSQTLAARPVLDKMIGGAVPALVRRWRDIHPDIDQPALDRHYLSIHLGGSKRLRRDGEGQHLVCDTDLTSHSIVPANAAYKWRTEGPVDFMHIYFDPAIVDQFVATTFDRDPRNVQLHDCLGESDPLICALSNSLMAELSSNRPAQQAYLDDIMHLLLFRMMRTCSDANRIVPRSDHALPAYKLRRALDFIESRLADPIGVADMSGAIGTSSFHFSRAFRHAMGRPPYAYLIERRIVRAQDLLNRPELSLEQIARQSGFVGASQLSRMFRRIMGMSPSEYRNQR